ncbi:MAG: histidinol dehydrogenase [bacterium]
MTNELFPLLSAADLAALPRQAVSAETLQAAAAILATVRRDGQESVIHYSRCFGDLGPDDQLLYDVDELTAALERIPADQRQLLERTADRIASFATAQRSCLQDLKLPVAGGRAGCRYLPVTRAGCYAPGGRFPLPSSLLMTTVTARVAGVQEIVVASPRPGDLILAAAALGGAQQLVATGGAQAIAALAYGAGEIPACDVIVGPGNRFVTAAKQLVAGQVGIDMRAGPSELVILADKTADPATVAADLLAQAEHDPEAIPILVSLDRVLPAAVNRELERQLVDLPTAAIARVALGNGGVVVADDLDQGIQLCNGLAPEHLELLTTSPEDLAARMTCYGTLFLGSTSAEVMGDYGAGPNHVLPTGGTARFRGSLSVADFLVGRTWLQLEPGPALDELVCDVTALARLEGLEGACPGGSAAR